MGQRVGGAARGWIGPHGIEALRQGGAPSCGRLGGQEQGALLAAGAQVYRDASKDNRTD